MINHNNYIYMNKEETNRRKTRNKDKFYDNPNVEEEKNAFDIVK